MLAGLMTVAGELLLLAVALGCQSWRGLLGAGAAPLTLFLSYGCDYLLINSISLFPLSDFIIIIILFSYLDIG